MKINSEEDFEKYVRVIVRDEIRKIAEEKNKPKTQKFIGETND